MLSLLKTWNNKYDLWSFFSDFIFVFGVLVLGWNPVLLILLYIIDLLVMLLFTIILFHIESKDIVKTIGFLFLSFVVVSCSVAFYIVVQGMVESLELAINTNPSQIINSYVLPIILVSSGLNHYAAFSESLQKRKEGTYKSTFIKHFFLKYVFLMVLILFTVFGQLFFNAAIVIALIGIKVFLRIWNKKYRDIL
ncbi:MAG: hypothetical protein COA97_11050 [Flavobacteriales bacterium]|nr:MAG: hypothetical protein COA97_11050 [Flavobacteriales bacterium]